MGNTCFIKAALQALARPLLVSRCELEKGTLAACAADAALHAVLGLQCSANALEDLLRSLPCGFGWRHALSLHRLISVQEDVHEVVLKVFDSVPDLLDAVRTLCVSSCVCDTCGLAREADDDAEADGDAVRALQDSLMQAEKCAKEAHAQALAAARRSERLAAQQ